MKRRLICICKYNVICTVDLKVEELVKNFQSWSEESQPGWLQNWPIEVKAEEWALLKENVEARKRVFPEAFFVEEPESYQCRTIAELGEALGVQYQKQLHNEEAKKVKLEIAKSKSELKEKSVILLNALQKGDTDLSRLV